MIDLTGKRFGRLTIICFGSTRWRCLCDCGETTWVRSGALRSGSTQSCGCLAKENLAAGITTTHGHSINGKSSKTFRAWLGAKARCNNPNNKDFKNYGGRGIKFQLYNFTDVLTHIGKCPPGMSLDRIDNNGNYEYGNIRWATPKEQNNNKRKIAMLENFTTEELKAEFLRREQLADRISRCHYLHLVA